MHDHDADCTPMRTAKQSQRVIRDYIEMITGVCTAAVDGPGPVFREHNAHDFYQSAKQELERYRRDYGADDEYQCLLRDLEEAYRAASDADGAL
jgi:hypothetical protein